MKNGTHNGNASVRAVKATALTPAMIEAWDRIVSENAELASPFFSPVYASTLGAIILDTEVGVMEADGKPVAFLPFHRGRRNIATRMRLSDYEGFVAPKDLQLDPQAFVKGCGLAAWDFNHLLAGQAALKPFHKLQDVSYTVDLSQGFERYMEERKQSGHMELIKRCGSKMRKLERERGEMRFEVHVPDRAILEQLLKWREAKYGSKHSLEMLMSVLGKLLDEKADHCQGTLSVVYARGEVVAGHFGLRSKSTWHWWFPAYNPEFEKYSPGLILILKMLENIALSGTNIIDFGKGDQDYKLHLMNSSIAVAEGSVEVSAALSLARSLKQGAKECLRRAPALDRMVRNIAGAGQPQ